MRKVLEIVLAGIPRKTLIALFKFYQRYISVFTKPRCRFIPTCSSYAIEAVEKYGAIKGLWIASKRFFRCNPFCKGGYDPVK